MHQFHIHSEEVYKYLPVREAITIIYEEELFFTENIKFINDHVQYSNRLNEEDMQLCIDILTKYNQEQEITCSDREYTLYYMTGEKKSNGLFIKGKRHGTHTFFFRNGSIREKIYFIHGERFGPSLSFNINGGLFSDRNFKQDKLHGIFVLYDSYERKLCSGEYKNGLKHGPYIEYFNNGSIYLKCHYIDNFIEGNFKKYYSNGKLNSNCNYKKGRKHGMQHLFTTRGVIVEKKSFQMGKKHGRQVYYSIIGDKHFICKTEMYAQGFLNGISKTFFNNGKVQKIIHYKGGQKNGIERIYKFDGDLYFSKRWKNGIEAEKLKLCKNEMNLRTFYETKNNVFLKTVPKAFLFGMMENESIPFKKSWDKQKLGNLLFENYCKKKKEEKESVDDSTDLFGNEIKNAVIGNDGGIYDLKSMKTLFQVENDRFINIQYHYVNNESVPNYPRMHNGKTLSTYYNLENLKNNNAIENRKELFDFLDTFEKKKILI